MPKGHKCSKFTPTERADTFECTCTTIYCAPRLHLCRDDDAQLQAVQAQTQALIQLATVISQHSNSNSLCSSSRKLPLPRPVWQEHKARRRQPCLPAWRTWKDRITEIHEYGVWLEAFTSWVSVLHSSFGPEIQEAVSRGPMASPLTHEIMTVEQIQKKPKSFTLTETSFCWFWKSGEHSGSVGICWRHAESQRIRVAAEDH